MPPATTDALYLERKALFAQLVQELDDDLASLKFNLSQITQDEGSLSPDDKALFDALARGVIHKWNYVCDLAESNPDEMFTGDLTYGPHNHALTTENIAQSLDDAHTQFTSVVMPEISTLITDGSISEDWRQFYGGGFGWSHHYTLSALADKLVSDTRSTATDAGLDPDEYLPRDETDTDRPSMSPAETIEDSARQLAAETESNTDNDSLSLPDSTTTETETETEQSPSDESESETDDDTEEWPGYNGEYLETPTGDVEPLAHTGRLPRTYTIEAVDYSQIREPECKNSCSFQGRYIVTLTNTSNGTTSYARVCSSCIPDAARGIAPNFELWKEGSQNNDGELVSKVKVANGSNYEWTERHFTAGNEHAPHNSVYARLSYSLSGDTIYISVQDGVTEHGREGNYSVEIDEFRGAIPYIEGKPIREWLLDRAKHHRDRLLHEEGGDRHLVSIDRDQKVISRAQRAYREQNPDFTQPAGMINDHTPVVDDCVTVCAECGEVVAGTSLENAEPCEKCGCEEATWMGEARDHGDDDTSPEQAA